MSKKDFPFITTYLHTPNIQIISEQSIFFFQKSIRKEKNCLRLDSSHAHT